MQLRMSTRTMEGVLVVDCSGRVVFGEESAALRDMVKKLLAQNPNIVMSLREVNYIDSGGLGTLVSLFTSARNAGGAVKLARLSKRVGSFSRSPSCSLFLKCSTMKKRLRGRSRKIRLRWFTGPRSSARSSH